MYSLLICLFIAATGVLASACGNATAGCTSVVSRGADADANHTLIQTALSNAMPGASVCLQPGTWALKSELTVSTDNVTIRGTAATQDGVILDFAGQTGAQAISVVSVAKFKISNLTVKNSAGDAIKVTQSQDVIFDHVTVTWDAGRNTMNGAYGLYPVQCTRVLVDSCKVSYASDAGIYVGQSSMIIVKNSEADSNVAGIEIENSSDAEVFGNHAHDNTAGILVFNLPDLMVKTGARTNVHNNRMINNIGPNFAAKSGIVSTVPSGTGLLVMGEKNGEFHDNDITGNDSVGVAVVSFNLVQRPWVDKTYDPIPEGNYIHDNRFSNNGMSPGGLAVTLAGLAHLKAVPDMVWDGLVDPAKMNVANALTNCFKNNGAATYVNMGFDPMSTDTNIIVHPTMDMTPVTCTHAPLSPITL